MAEQDLNQVVWLRFGSGNLTLKLCGKDGLNGHVQQLFFQSHHILSLDLVRLSESKRPKHRVLASLLPPS